MTISHFHFSRTKKHTKHNSELNPYPKHNLNSKPKPRIQNPNSKPLIPKLNMCLFFWPFNKLHEKHLENTERLWKYKIWCCSIKTGISASKAKPAMVRAKPMTLWIAGIEISCSIRFTALLLSRTQCYIWHNMFS